MIAESLLSDVSERVTPVEFLHEEPVELEPETNLAATH
jgi:hypothetical protein